MSAKRPPTVLNRFKGPYGKVRLIDALRDQFVVGGDLKLAQSLAKRIKLVELKKGQVLLEQGTADNDIFFVLAGTVTVLVNGREIAQRDAGNHVGEMALIDNTAVRSATVIAEVPTIVAKLADHVFEDLANRHPLLWRRIAISIGVRLRERDRFHTPPRNQPAIFIASSSEGLDIANAIHKFLLRKPVVPHLWSEGVFQASQTTIEELMRITRETDFAVIVMTADDVTRSRGIRKPSPRDNVIFELGLFMGALSKERTFIVAGDKIDIKVPTDLLGLTLLRFRRKAKVSLGIALRDVKNALYRSIVRIGPR